MKTGSRLVKNTSFVLFSEILNKLFSFFFLAYAARILGPANFGIYALIGTLVFFFSYLGNFGLVPMAIREIAKDKIKFEELFNHILSLRMVLVVAVYPVLLAAVNILGYEPEVKHLIYIAGISVIFSTFSGSFRILYIAFERFKMPSLISSLVSFFSNFANVVVLFLGFGLKGLIIVSFIGNILGAIISGLWVRNRFFRYRIVFHPSAWKNLISQSLPFAVLSFFQQATVHMNILLLSRVPGPFRADVAMGYYSPPSSLCRASLIFPQSFWQAALPTIASNAGNLAMIEGIIGKATKSLLSVVIFPLILAATIFPGEILTLLFGERYLVSSPAFTILGLAYALQVYNAPISVTLSASREIRQFIPWAAVVLGINFILAIPLIMYYSFVGAAVAFLVSRIIETVMRHYLLRKIWGIRSLNTMRSLFSVLFPIVLIFALLLIARSSGLGAGMLFLLAVILYSAALFVFKDLRQGIVLLVDGLKRRTILRHGE